MTAAIAYPTTNLIGVPDQCLEAQAMVLPEGLSLEALSGVYGSLNTADEGLRWWMGDLILYGERAYGETAYQMFPLNKAQTLKQYGWVAERIPRAERVPGASWSHHRAVAAIDSPTLRQQWLQTAVEEEWSKSKLEEALRSERGQTRRRRDLRGVAALSAERLGDTWQQEDHEALLALLGLTKWTA